MEDTALKDLYAQRAAINERIWSIEAADRQRRHAELIGKAFVYMNSFSGSDRWPLYTLVVSMEESGYLKAFQFETDVNGCISIRLNETRISVNDGYREIPRAEFDAAWLGLLGKLGAHFPH